MEETQLLHVRDSIPLDAPREIKAKHPITEKIADFVSSSRSHIQNILKGADKRLLVIVGPCSIHSQKVAMEYAEKLSKLSSQVNKNLFIVMRAYVAKPRTTTGWKGFMYDPDLNGRNDIERGLYKSRYMMLEINKLGLPVATEFLDGQTPRVIADLVSWGAIGARTIESQPHREMASGLSMPVGFKNSTDGNIDVALNAMVSAIQPHVFLGIDDDGQWARITTSGNPWGHIVLRGGSDSPNYTPSKVKKAIQKLEHKELNAHLVIDCSHANARKVFEKQESVCDSVIRQRKTNKNIVGIMIESNLRSGKQNVPKDLRDVDDLEYGVSITDPCISWNKTEAIIKKLNRSVSRNNN